MSEPKTIDDLKAEVEALLACHTHLHRSLKAKVLHDAAEQLYVGITSQHEFERMKALDPELTVSEYSRVKQEWNAAKREFKRRDGAECDRMKQELKPIYTKSGQGATVAACLDDRIEGRSDLTPERCTAEFRVGSMRVEEYMVPMRDGSTAVVWVRDRAASLQFDGRVNPLIYLTCTGATQEVAARQKVLEAFCWYWEVPKQRALPVAKVLKGAVSAVTSYGGTFVKGYVNFPQRTTNGEGNKLYNAATLPKSAPTGDQQPDRISFERFTDRSRRVLQLARQEALRMGRKSITGADLLLGLVKLGSGMACDVLEGLKISISISISIGNIRNRTERLLKDEGDASGVHAVTGTPTCREVDEVLRSAVKWVGNLMVGRIRHHNFVDTEHLLLGLVSVVNSSQVVLLDLGISCEAVQAAVMKSLGLTPSHESVIPCYRCGKEVCQCATIAEGVNVLGSQVQTMEQRPYHRVDRLVYGVNYPLCDGCKISLPGQFKRPGESNLCSRCSKNLPTKEVTGLPGVSKEDEARMAEQLAQGLTSDVQGFFDMKTLPVAAPTGEPRLVELPPRLGERFLGAMIDASNPVNHIKPCGEVQLGGVAQAAVESVEERVMRVDPAEGEFRSSEPTWRDRPPLL